MTTFLQKTALALASMLIALALVQASCDDECTSGHYDLNGECVTACDPGWFLGIDGRCHPIEGPDGDVDSDTDNDRDSDVSVATDTDIDPDLELEPEADIDGGRTDGDVFTAGCVDEESCAALAQPALDLINTSREVDGCVDGALSLDSRVSAAARECVELMVSIESLEVCWGTVRARLSTQGVEGYQDVSEVYARHRTIGGAIEQLLSSPATGPVLLDCRFSLAGLAIAPGADGDSFYIAVILVET